MFKDISTSFIQQLFNQLKSYNLVSQYELNLHFMARNLLFFNRSMYYCKLFVDNESTSNLNFFLGMNIERRMNDLQLFESRIS